jgi:hypothetical protein
MDEPSQTRFAALRNWWNELTESQRDAARFGGVAVALVLLGAAGYVAARPFWRRHQHGEAMAQAAQFAETGDYRQMLLALRRATELAPTDIATWREVATRLAELGSPEAIGARQNLAVLAPDDVSLRQALVVEALRFGENGLAQSELTRIDAAAQRDAAFYRLAAAVALASGQDAELEASLVRLVQLAPEDALARFNLAAVRLWSANAAHSAAAIVELEQLTELPAVRIRAALELLKQAARQRDPARLARLVPLLLARLSPPGAAVQPTGDPPGWQQLIAALKSAATTPADIAAVARWLAEVRLARPAIVWIETLPEAARRAPEVLDAAAEISAMLDDRWRIEVLLRGGAWGPMPDDALVLALAAHVQQARGAAERAKDTWRDAVAAATGSPGGLRNLARLARAWRDTAGMEHALEALIERAPKTDWAYVALRSSYAQRRDAAALWQLHEAWRRARPDDAALACDWALLCSLLDRNIPEALARMQALHAAAPRDPQVTLALAATLWRAKKPAEALRHLETLDAATRDRRDVIFWATLALADVGRKSEAAATLRQAWHADLTPEQQALLREAAARIGLSIAR